eukprot:TRINITY_DN749_c0_g1_i1.p1 TRINITY_DN749_c0_g1~~TRINITY_DN749_c0_g1_i1.p1  ORF type:complete len:206 (-),score=27.94 TRINITY_DN749_c0_g1_i1:272-847(-)
MDHKKIVFFLWLVTELIAVCFTISLWAVAGKIRSEYKDGISTSELNHTLFPYVWVSLPLILGGAIFSILVSWREEFKTTLNFGIMIGMHIINLNLGLIYAVACTTDTKGIYDSSQYKACAAFGSLFFIFGLFLVGLWIAWRDDFLEAAESSNPYSHSQDSQPRQPQYQSPETHAPVDSTIPPAATATTTPV